MIRVYLTPRYQGQSVIIVATELFADRWLIFHQTGGWIGTDTVIQYCTAIFMLIAAR